MSTVTIELPDSLRKSIEALAAKEGYSVSQFLASAASEKSGGHSDDGLSASRGRHKPLA